jgi:NADH-ubiquinone oxidoreductase chain 2
MLLVTIGYSLYFYVEKTPQKEIGQPHNSAVHSLQSALSGEISDKNNSPIQLISQLKGYFYINPYLALSLAITIFSFVGVPPLIGFFAKQMVLSSALDNGYVFMALVAILTSVISACYYLALIKQMFFDKTDYILNPVLKNITVKGNIVNKMTNRVIKDTTIKIENIVLSTSLTATISILTLTILFFILIPQE